MLVRPDGEGALVIGQLSHSWLSGQLARAWGNERVPPPEPREGVALGAEQHDIGWAAYDLEPGLNPDTGLPRTFLETSVEEHLRIWRTAPDALTTQSQHAALVVSLHGRSLSELRARAAPEQAELLAVHIAAERERQERLRSALGLSEAAVERIRRQMWTWDGISLALCNAWRPFTVRDTPVAEGLADIELRDLADGRSTLDPWPFAEDLVQVRCEARRLQGRATDERSLRDALARAAPVTLQFALARV
jgi:hypothetical protein